MKSLIAQRLREAREKRGLTQVDVSKATGINNKTLSGYENDVSNPDLETLKILANQYKVTTDYLLGSEQNNFMVSGRANEFRETPALYEVSPED